MNELSTMPSWVSWLIVFSIVWTLPWKAVALWKSAKTGDKVWFIMLLILNTLGILEIFYIFVFSKRTKKESSEKK
jgi:hypothetical protein